VHPWLVNTLDGGYDEDVRGAWLCLLVACNFERGDAAPDAFDIARDCPTTYTLELPG
jgi:hypothetical protein